MCMCARAWYACVCVWPCVCKISCEGAQISSVPAEPVGFLPALGVQGSTQTVMVPRAYKLYLTLRMEATHLYPL